VEQFERFEIVDNNYDGPLVKIRNVADGEEMWARRSRLRKFDGAWMILTERQHELLVAGRKRQAAKANKAAESKTQNEVTA
jgi:hypothetical protein